MRCEYCVSAGCVRVADGVRVAHLSSLALPLTAVQHNALQITQPAAYLLVILEWVTTCVGRGPHHPHGQHAVDHKHHHYKPSSDSLTSDTKLLHDTKVESQLTDNSTELFQAYMKKHIEEDAKVLTAEALARMTPEELEFHYFSSHDCDKNSKLDGLEMLKAVYHTIEHSFPDPEEDDSIEPEVEDMESFIAIVDRTLQTDDTDGDGYVSYSEYRAARIHNTEDRTPRIVNAPS